MNPYDPSPNVQRKEGVSSLDVIKTSPIEVAKFIRNIKKSQFSQCGIPGKFIHLIATPISFSMSKLFNNLFEIGLFPNLCKLVHVTDEDAKMSAKVRDQKTYNTTKQWEL